VQAVVTGHGGTVTVSSDPGRTVFTVRLPHATAVEPDVDADEWDDGPVGRPDRAAEPAAL
jgi:two-component system OmpR family sensor kinase